MGLEVIDKLDNEEYARIWAKQNNITPKISNYTERPYYWSKSDLPDILHGNLSLGHASEEGAYRNLGAFLRRIINIVRLHEED